MYGRSTVRGTIASRWPKRRLDSARPKSSGSFSRVVCWTTREKLPEDFGLAESNYRFGHLDAIVPRPELKDYVARLLRLFGNAG